MVHCSPQLNIVFVQPTLVGLNHVLPSPAITETIRILSHFPSYSRSKLKLWVLPLFYIQMWRSVCLYFTHKTLSPFAVTLQTTKAFGDVYRLAMEWLYHKSDDFPLDTMLPSGAAVKWRVHCGLGFWMLLGYFWCTSWRSELGVDFCRLGKVRRGCCIRTQYQKVVRISFAWYFSDAGMCCISTAMF